MTKLEPQESIQNYNDISHWDTSKVQDITKYPEIMAMIKEMRKDLGLEQIFNNKKEKFLYYSKELIKYLVQLILTFSIIILICYLIGPIKC